MPDTWTVPSALSPSKYSDPLLPPGKPKGDPPQGCIAPPEPARPWSFIASFKYTTIMGKKFSRTFQRV